MSRNRGKSPKLDLELNLSPSSTRSSSRRTAVDDDSSSSSCISSENEQGLRCSNSPEAMPMVLAGCPRCLMYVMLLEEDPKCPRCKSSVILHFHRDKSNTKKNRES
ncbi:protein GL2-INTERACTING REPRESSOR 1 [Typha angustifolia]|uniref:protein GL2-INTERACTING REPRESSOR 1 n=1 Tax=Typha angustifolia TaxID=59011 RepID=UPI003C30135B